MSPGRQRRQARTVRIQSDWGKHGQREVIIELFKEEIGAAVGRAQANDKGPMYHQLPMHCPFPDNSTMVYNKKTKKSFTAFKYFWARSRYKRQKHQYIKHSWSCCKILSTLIYINGRNRCFAKSHGSGCRIFSKYMYFAGAWCWPSPLRQHDLLLLWLWSLVQ